MITPKYNLARLSALETDLAVQSASLLAVSDLATEAGQDASRKRALAFQAGPAGITFTSLEDLRAHVQQFAESESIGPADLWKATQCRALVDDAVRTAEQAATLRARTDAAAQDLAPLRTLVSACRAYASPGVFVSTRGRGATA